jgi:hypothetical protein
MIDDLSITTVPEPAAVSLLLAGLIAIAGYLRSSNRFLKEKQARY